MYFQYEISRMQKEDIDQSIEIWLNQYNRYCNNSEFPAYWRNKTSELQSFLEKKVENRCAIVAKLNNSIAGFLGYDIFPFNGEKSVFCPAIAHSAVEEYKESVYLALYKYISQEWVDNNIFNHMWIIFFNDTELRNILFDLGYGSYVIDAFGSLNIRSKNDCKYVIRKATIDDIDSLYELVEDSLGYYRSAPLFLKRDRMSKEDIIEIVSNNNVFLAFDNDTLIGFINLSTSKSNNVIDMSVNNCGLIDEIGAYIKPEYRSKGIGRELLIRVGECCRENNISCVHVDFETANLYGNKFWRKYFSPMLLSMRRTINKNINDK